MALRRTFCGFLGDPHILRFEGCAALRDGRAGWGRWRRKFCRISSVYAGSLRKPPAKLCPTIYADGIVWPPWSFVSRTCLGTALLPRQGYFSEPFPHTLGRLFQFNIVFSTRRKGTTI